MDAIDWYGPSVGRLVAIKDVDPLRVYLILATRTAAEPIKFSSLMTLAYYAESSVGHPGRFLASIVAPNLTCLKITLVMRESWSKADVTTLAQFLPKFPALRELNLLGGDVHEEMLPVVPGPIAKKLATPLLKAIPASLTTLMVCLPRTQEEIKTPMFVTRVIVIPPRVEDLDLTPIASEDDAFDIAKRIPLTVRSLQFWFHISPRVMQALASTPRPYLKTLILSGVRSDCDANMVAALDRILVPTVTELWIATTDERRMDGRALAPVFRVRIPNVARLELLGFKMDKGDMTAIINALPTRSLNRLGVRVPNMSSDEIAELLLKRKDWRKLQLGLEDNPSVSIAEKLKACGLWE
ncbi:hypothetical protein GGF32_001452 [Allomyces javanicus]|nr:hypothetical protein GGF32_001452 [Allomyces javanicus]